MTLASLARQNLERAYDLLGARPDGSIDVRIKPTIPISANFQVEGTSAYGKAWIARFVPDRAVFGNRELARLKQDMLEWNVRHETDFGVTVERADP